jgi:tRNA(Ile)-lysidine synthase
VLVRPLLGYSKKDILKFCEREGLEFVTDSTNAEGDCSRNRLRLGAVPLLEGEFPDLQERVYRMTRSLSLDQDYLTGEAERFLASHLCDGGMSAKALRDAHPAIRRRALSMLLPRTLEAVHLEAVDALLEKGESGSSISLPGDTSACLQGDVLRIVPDLRLSDGFEPFDFDIGSASLCDGRLTVCIKSYEKTERTDNVHGEYTSVCMIKREVLDGTGEKLFFRPRRARDVLLRNGVRREVRRLYRESGVPVAIRDSLPLLCMGERVLWVPFVGAMDGFGEKIASAENLILTVSVSACRKAEQKGR